MQFYLAGSQQRTSSCVTVAGSSLLQLRRKRASFHCMTADVHDVLCKFNGVSGVPLLDSHLRQRGKRPWPMTRCGNISGIVQHPAASSTQHAAFCIVQHDIVLQPFNRQQTAACNSDLGWRRVC